MKEKVLIVEDQFVEAHNLRLMLMQAGYNVLGIARSVLKATEMIKQEKPDLVLLDIFLQGKLTGIDLARQLGKENIAFVYLSANSNEEVLNAAKTTQPYGFLVKPFRERDLLVTLEIARYRHEHSMDSYFRRETILSDQLSAIIASTESWDKKLLHIGRTLQPYIPFDYITAGFDTLHDISSQGLSFLRIGYDEYQQIGVPELLMMTGLTIKELVALAKSTSYDAPAAMPGQQPCLHQLFADTFRMRSHLTFPLRLSTGEVLSCCFYSRKQATYNADHTGLLDHLQKPVTVTSPNNGYPEAPVKVATTPGLKGLLEEATSC